MKPSNPYLGSSPLRTSRVGSIDVLDKSWDSVVFQQSKSILDFDLNVMQRIFQESIKQLSRTLYKSGFLGTPVFSSVDTSGVLYMTDSNASIFGSVIRVADFNGTTQSINGNSYTQCIKIDSSTYSGTVSSNTSTLTTTSKTFVWLEAWFQEIAPTLTDESIDSTSLLDKKATTVYTYGMDPSPWMSNPSIKTNELKDTGFGAETTRRIQLRWRIRQTPNVNPSTYPKGFSNSTGSSINPAVFAQGGRPNVVLTGCSGSGTAFTVPTNGIVSGYLSQGITLTGLGIPFSVSSGVLSSTKIQSFGTGTAKVGGTYTLDTASSISSGSTVYGWFTPSITFQRADLTSGDDFSKGNDSQVFIAGSGSASDAALLNTVDGRSYGIPIGFIGPSAVGGAVQFDTSPIFIITGASLTNATANQLTMATGSTPLVLSQNIITANPDGSGNASIAINPVGNGSVIIGGSGTADNGKLQLPASGQNVSASSPSIEFGSTNSGFYYDSTSGVGITDGGQNISYFTKNVGLTVPKTVSAGALTVTGTVAGGTGLSSARFIGQNISTSTPPTPASGSYLTGDFVVDARGFVYVYNGTSWVIAGVSSANANTWTALNQFTAPATHSVSGNYTENIYAGPTTATLSSTAFNSNSISSSKIDVLTVAASTTGTTLGNASNLEITGVPTRGGTVTNLTLSNAYGVRITSNQSTALNAYGLYVERPTSTSSTASYYSGYFYSKTLAATTDIINMSIVSEDTSSSNSVNKIALNITSTGAWAGTSSTQKSINVSASGGAGTLNYGAYIVSSGSSLSNIGLYASASGGTNNYAAVFPAGTVGIGTATPGTTYALDVSGTTRFSSDVTITSGNINITSGNITGSNGQLSYSSTTSGLIDNWTANLFSATNTSTTASKTKTGVSILSTGAWSGTSSVNRALHVKATDGTVNYAAIFESGQVGIGTTAPTSGYLLDISGSVRSTGSIGLVNSTYTLTLQTATLTANRVITFPNITGTVALSTTPNTFSSTSTFSGTPAAIVGSGDSATPTGGTLRASSGVGTNIAGSSLTIAGGGGTGTSAGGDIIFQSSLSGSTGSTANAFSELFRIGPSGANSSIPLYMNGQEIRATPTGSSSLLLVTGGSSYSSGNGSAVIFRGSGNATNAGGIEFFGSSGTTITERMRMLASGNLGLGITSPNYLLHLNVSGTSTANYLQITNGSTGYTSSDGVLFGVDSNNEAVVWYQESSVLKFATANTERMRVDSTGKVGIGTTSPAGTLHVNGSVAGAVAPRCFIPASAFTGNATLSTDGTTAQFYYAFASGNIIYAYIAVPTNYVTGRACTFTIFGTLTGHSVAYSLNGGTYTAFTSGTTSFASTNQSLVIRITGGTGNLNGMFIEFGS